jgi:Ca2+/Na+ antiporter
VQTYLITVILFSVLFLIFSYYLSFRLKLSRVTVMICSLFVCLAVLSLPLFFINNYMGYWLLIVFSVFVIIFYKFSKDYLNKKTIINKDEDTEKLKSETNIDPLKAYLKQPQPDVDLLEAYSKQPQTDLVPLNTDLLPLKTDIEPPETDPDLLKTSEEPDLLIDEINYEDQKPLLDVLIDMAFKAKSYGLLDESIKLFVQALDLNPPPDMAFYLIMDAYSMIDFSKDKTTITQRLIEHCRRYKNDMPSEMKDIFEKWLIEENLGEAMGIF